MTAWLKSLKLQPSLKALHDCHRIMTTTDFRPELPAIRLPTQVIQGDRDASVPLALSGRPLAAAIPGARLAIYEGAPHGLFVTHMHRLTADLAAFAEA
jgi:pimeloyl-ACP methyl ester carboxylesterase